MTGRVGIISHLGDLTFAAARTLARAAEEAGADWVGLPDAFWWRDTWVLLAEAARVTDHIGLGPVVTNPYMRHPWQTAAAAATLQDLAGPRVVLGVGAGGAEISQLAGIDRGDAPRRVEDLLEAVRGGPSGPRGLRAPTPPGPRIMVAGRAPGLLGVAGRAGDDALLWAVPSSELDHSIDVVRRAAATRSGALGPGPELVWAPLVAHDRATEAHVRRIAAYSVLNSRSTSRRRWGLDDGATAELRALVARDGPEAAAYRLPEAALDDLVVTDPDPSAVAERAASRGIAHLAVPVFTVDEVDERVRWARRALSPSPVPTTRSAP